MTTFWKNRRVLVTGGAGFLGSVIVRQLQEKGAADVFVPRSRTYDLRTLSGVTRALDDAKPDVVIHLAARVGGIGANGAQPADFFYDNLMMSVPLLHEAWQAGVNKFVAWYKDFYEIKL